MNNKTILTFFKSYDFKYKLFAILTTLKISLNRITDFLLDNSEMNIIRDTNPTLFSKESIKSQYTKNVCLFLQLHSFLFIISMIFY